MSAKRVEPIDKLTYEFEAYLAGYEHVAGVDEAGRGPLAGPVVAAAVILPRGLIIDGLDDSKKLSDRKRREVYSIIKRDALAYSIATMSNMDIDQNNILNATFKCMNKALTKLSIKPDFVFIDGNTSRFIQYKYQCIIKGDQKSMSIAAASVLAKVTRDDIMIGYDKIYPQYNFAQHKGYPTKAHIAKLREIGPCDIHRRSFLKKILAEKK